MHESIIFLVRVQCRRKESSRSLSHLLMIFDFLVYQYSTLAIIHSHSCRAVDEDIILLRLVSTNDF